MRLRALCSAQLASILKKINEKTIVSNQNLSGKADSDENRMPRENEEIARRLDDLFDQYEDEDEDEEEEEEEEGEDFTELTSDLEDDLAWIEWFCHLKGNEFFVEVDDEYIRDDFNLTGLSACVPCYTKALNILLDNHTDDGSSASEEPRRQVLTGATHQLYGLVHARFILTQRGMQLMLQKYQAAVFGHCPNTFCTNQPVMPVGLADTPGYDSAKVFCPNCNEIYHPTSSRLASIDGAYFGTTFPHLFFLQYDQLVPQNTPQYYIPKIYGFRVYKKLKDRLRSKAVDRLQQHTQQKQAQEEQQAV